MASIWTADSRSESLNQVCQSPARVNSHQLTFHGDENIALGDQQIAEEVDQTGRIVVKLRRGHFANRKAAEGKNMQSFDPPEHVDLEATCKEVVHKHGVSHVLKYVPRH